MNATNDCFGWTEKVEGSGHYICSALNAKTQGCGTVQCPFYKPDRNLVRKEQYDPKTGSIRVSFERLKHDIS